MREKMDLQKMSWRQLFDMHKKLAEKDYLSIIEKEDLDAIEEELLEREEEVQFY